jgi:hypothetical protein
MIGSDTLRRLPGQTPVQFVPGLRLKGKESPVDAYLLRTPQPVE